MQLQIHQENIENLSMNAAHNTERHNKWVISISQDSAVCYLNLPADHLFILLSDEISSEWLYT